MKRFEQVAVLLCVFFLVSCMATPNIRLKAGGVEMELIQPLPMIAPGDVSPDGKFLLTGGWKENSFKLWDISKGAQIKKFSTEGSWSLPVYVRFSPDGKYILSGGTALKLWDLSSGKEMKTLVNLGTVTVPSFSADSGKIAVFLANDAATRFNAKHQFGVWTAMDGREVAVFNDDDWRTTKSEVWPYSFGQSLNSTALSPDARYVLSGHMPLGGGMMGKTAKSILWDAATGRKIREFNASEGHSPPAVFSVAFSPDGKQALSGGSDGTVRIWDMMSGAELKRLSGHTGTMGVVFVKFSRNGKYIFSGGADGFLKVWDTSSGAEIGSYGGYSGSSSSMIIQAVGYADLLPDGRHVVSMATDGAVRVWNISTGEETALLLSFEDGEWLAITSEGYYNASEKGAQYLKVKYEGSEYTVDQFYDVFYRPDIVAAKLAGQDISGLISITMKDARKLPPPRIEFTSHSAGNDQQKAKVCYQVKNSGGGIGEVRLFHNGKLIESDGYYREAAKAPGDRTQLASLSSNAIYENMRSVSLKGTAGNTPVSARAKGDLLEECREIEAVPGENDVSITAFNGDNTVQSNVKTISFSSNVKTDAPHLYILSVGIDRYRESSVNLKYAVKDAKDLNEKIKKQSATLYEPKNIHCDLLTDQEATKVNIANKISELSRIIKPRDSFILFVAGHGVLLQNQYYLLTHDFTGQASADSMISSNEIVEASKKIKSLSQLFIFDTCHAGGVDTIVSGLYDARMSVLARKMGLHIYASANDKQTAMDGYKDNGLFTHVLLDGLNNNREADKNKDGKVTIAGLGEYSKNKTTSLSREIGHSQTPMIINFGKDSPVYILQ